MEAWYKLSLREEFEKNQKLKQEMIAEMRVWLETQPHLPQLLPDMELLFHIQSCDFEVDQAKKALDINYTIRTKADIFKERDPNSQETITSLQTLNQICINQVDDEGNHCIMGRLENLDSDKYDFTHTMRYSLLIMDYMRIEYGTAPGLIAIIDVRGFTISHLIKVPLGGSRQFMKFLQEGSPTKLISFHMINTAGSIIDKVMMLIKPLLNERTSKLIHFHPGYETLYDHGIKRDKIPIEYGGNAGPIKELSVETHKKLQDCAGFFKQEENHRVDESKRSRSKLFGWF